MRILGRSTRRWGITKKSRRQRNSTRKTIHPLRSYLSLEHLETRIALSVNPVLTVVGDQVVDEGSLLSLTELGAFTDVVEGSGSSSVGLNPNDFSSFSLGVFDPVADVVIDTDALTISGLSGTGTTQLADIGFGSFEIAVFTFDSFELDAGVTLTATGSRPLALLSLNDITVDGVIDVSAPGVVDQFGVRVGQAPGPGGGGGGIGPPPVPVDGEGAAGAPLSAPIQGFGKNIGNSARGGGGGAFGGDGGRAFDGTLTNSQGHAYGDLAVAIQGGSGGAAGNGAVGLQGFFEGGGGGGGVELGANGSATINGTIVADGADGNYTNIASGGGGAGGGISVHATNVSVTGTLQADGGRGTFFVFGTSTLVGSSAGGGGGGRILLAHDASGTLNTSGATLSVQGGGSGPNSEDGAVGDISLVTVVSTPTFETYDFSIDWGDNTLIDVGFDVIDSLGSVGGPDTTGSFDGSHTYADDGVFTVNVTLNDSGGGTDTKSFTVTVNNVDPTADAGGPYTTFDDLPITLNGSGFDVAGPADPLLFEWDFDNDFNTVEAVGESVTFDPAALGITMTTVVTVSLRVSDGDGGMAIDTADVNVLSEGALVIDGTLHIVGSNTAADEIFVRDNAGDVEVFASFNNDVPVLFDSADVNDINIRTRVGDDRVIVSASIALDVTIDGGGGNDVLLGGSGNDLIFGGLGNDLMAGQGGNDKLLAGEGSDDLFGGSGDDVLVAGADGDLLFGGSGRDLMIGGLDSDFLYGGSGDDILIGGVTIHDNDTAALDAVMDIWTSSDSFDSRIAQLTGVGGLLESGVSVFDDDDTDIMIGGSGRDLVFADTTFAGGDFDFVFINSSFDHLIATN